MACDLSLDPSGKHMPKEFAHQMLAERLIHRLLSGGMPTVARCLARNSWAFFSGCLAPDTLYYDIPDPTYVRLPHSAVPIARGLHRAHDAAIYSVPLFLLKELRNRSQNSTACLAFVLGFLSHLAVDMTFHPVVIRFVADRPARGSGERAAHFRLESTLDGALCQKFGSSLRQMNLRRAARIRSAQSVQLVRFYARGLTVLSDWSETDLCYALRRAFCKQVWLNRLFQQPLFFQFTQFLSRHWPEKMDEFHALAHPPVWGLKGEAAAGRSWLWAARCWRSIQLDKLVEMSLLRAELMVRQALNYLHGKTNRRQVEEAFMRITPSTGLRGYP